VTQIKDFNKKHIIIKVYAQRPIFALRYFPLLQAQGLFKQAAIYLSFLPVSKSLQTVCHLCSHSRTYFPAFLSLPS